MKNDAGMGTHRSVRTRAQERGREDGQGHEDGWGSEDEGARGWMGARERGQRDTGMGTRRREDRDEVMWRADRMRERGHGDRDKENNSNARKAIRTRGRDVGTGTIQTIRA